MRFLVPALCAIAFSNAAMAQAVSPDVIPKGTPVRLRLDTTLRSGQAKVGAPVQFTVAANIDGPRQTLLVARGAPATGRITKSEGKGKFGRPGKLIFTCDSMQAADGTQIPLHLVVEAGSGSGPAADAADVTDAQEYRAFSAPDFDPKGYVQSSQSGGYYFQTTGDSSSLIYDLARFFGGQDAVVKRGQKYSAKVVADTPLNAASY